MVIPADDPSEPCYEAETVKFLREPNRMPACKSPWMLPIKLLSKPCPGGGDAYSAARQHSLLIQGL